MTGAVSEWGDATNGASVLPGIIKDWGGASVDWSCQREGGSCIASIEKCPLRVTLALEEIAASRSAKQKQLHSVTNAVKLLVISMRR